MRLQLHHQHRNGTTRFVSQRDNLRTQEDIRSWSKEMMLKHPLPSALYRWVIVTEESPLFVKAEQQAPVKDGDNSS